MTDQRNEMPNEIWAHEMSANRDGRHGGWTEGECTGRTAYVRKGISPPVPDDVAEAVKQFALEYWNAKPDIYGQGFKNIPDLALKVYERFCIRAASTPSAEVQSMKDQISGLNSIISGQGDEIQTLKDIFTKVEILIRAANGLNTLSLLEALNHTGGK